jgi:hypothetical protein
MALATVWAAIAAAYVTDWPVGFFVTAGSALLYGAGRFWVFWAARARRLQPGPVAALRAVDESSLL